MKSVISLSSKLYRNRQKIDFIVLTRENSQCLLFVVTRRDYKSTQNGFIRGVYFYKS